MRRFEYTLFPRFCIAAETEEEADQAMHKLRISHQIYVTYGSSVSLDGTKKVPIIFDVVARREIGDNDEPGQEISYEPVREEPPETH